MRQLHPIVSASALAALVATYAACNIGKKGESAAPVAVSADATAATPVVSGPVQPLLGSWKAVACQSANAAGAASSSAYAVFQGDTVIYAENFYSDAKCATRLYTETTTGDYALGDPSATVANATNIDLNYNQRTITYLSPAAATSGAEGFTSGANPFCPAGSTPTLNGELVDLTPCLGDATTLIQHTTVLLSGQTMVLAGSGTFTKN